MPFVEDSRGGIAAEFTILKYIIDYMITIRIRLNVDPALRRSAAGISESGIPDQQIFRTDDADPLPVMIIAGHIVNEHIAAPSQSGTGADVNTVAAARFQSEPGNDDVTCPAEADQMPPL